MTGLDQQGVTSVLPVSGCISAVAGVFYWVWVTAVGLQAEACLDVVGATDGCAVGAVGALISEQVGVDRVATGCRATSTLVFMSDLTASG